MVLLFSTRFKTISIVYDIQQCANLYSICHESVQKLNPNLFQISRVQFMKPFPSIYCKFGFSFHTDLFEKIANKWIAACVKLLWSKA